MNSNKVHQIVCSSRDERDVFLKHKGQSESEGLHFYPTLRIFCYGITNLFETAPVRSINSIKRGTPVGNTQKESIRILTQICVVKFIDVELNCICCITNKKQLHFVLRAGRPVQYWRLLIDESGENTGREWKGPSWVFNGFYMSVKMCSDVLNARGRVEECITTPQTKFSNLGFSDESVSRR